VPTSIVVSDANQVNDILTLGLLVCLYMERNHYGLYVLNFAGLANIGRP
jgi:hypothetical protein